MAKRPHSPDHSRSRKRANTIPNPPPNTPPGPSRKTAPIDFQNTIRVVADGFNQAGEMDGRESAYYEPLNEAFGYFSRSAQLRPGEVGRNKITVAPQFSFRREMRPATAGSTTRDERVQTRAHAAAEGIEIPDLPDMTDPSAHGVDDVELQNISAHTTKSLDERLAAFEKPKDAWSTPDATLFRNCFEWNEDTQSYDVSRVPFCIIEAKPPRMDLSTEALAPLPSEQAIEEARSVIDGTRAQMARQIKAVFDEYKNPEDIQVLFVFVFAGKYFTFHKLKHGAKGLPPKKDAQHKILSLLNDDGTDFSDSFYRCWKQMMEACDIEMLKGFIKD